jgi:hypothetical protein
MIAAAAQAFTIAMQSIAATESAVAETMTALAWHFAHPRRHVAIRDERGRIVEAHELVERSRN